MHDQPTNNTNTLSNLDSHAVRRLELLFVPVLPNSESPIPTREQLQSAKFDGCEFSLGSSGPIMLSGQIDLLIRSMERASIPVPAAELSLTECDAGRSADELNLMVPHLRNRGVRYLNLVMPRLVHWTSMDRGFKRFQDLLNFAHALLRGVRFEAEAWGAEVGFVAGAHGCFLSPVELRELIDSVGSWSVGACLDTSLLREGPSLEDWVATLGPRTKTIRLAAESTAAAHKPSVVHSNSGFEENESLLDEIHFDGAIVLRS